MRLPTTRQRSCKPICAAGPPPNAPLHNRKEQCPEFTQFGSFAGSNSTYSKEMTVQDKPVALVSGANQGIGLQIARDLVAHGFTVLVGSRNLERGEAAARTIDGDAHALQLDVTDPASIAAAAERTRNEFGRLDVLVQNAAISNTNKLPGQSVEAYAKTTRPSNVSLDEMRAVWDTNVFGVLAVYQAMLPLLREAPEARIVNVSSGVGSLTTNSDPAYAYRAIFGPVYPASKTALNALTVAMALELEPEGIKVSAVSPGFTKTNLNGYAGTETVEEGAREAVRVALLGRDSPTGTFTRWENETIPW
jgi:NAD(P)-dependent dehydrogenase (short-subunit alcohol dehydrogenase family)